MAIYDIRQDPAMQRYNELLLTNPALAERIDARANELYSSTSESRVYNRAARDVVIPEGGGPESAYREESRATALRTAIEELDQPTDAPEGVELGAQQPPTAADSVQSTPEDFLKRLKALDLSKEKPEPEQPAALSSQQLENLKLLQLSPGSRAASPEEQNYWDRVSGSFERGLSSADIDQSIFLAANNLSASPEERERNVRLWLEEKKKIEAQAPPRAGGSIIDIFTKPTEAIPQVGEDIAALAGPMVKSQLQAGTVAAAGALAGGAATGPAAPAGAAAGAATGWALGSLQYWYRQGYGSALGGMLEQDVPFESANVAAATVAPFYAFIERLQLGRLMKYVPDSILSENARKALAAHADDMVAKVAKKVATRVGGPQAAKIAEVGGQITGDTAVQLGQELAQEMLLQGSKDIAAVTDRIIGEGEAEFSKAEDWEKAAKDVWEMSGALAVLSGAGRMGGAGLNRRQETKALKTVVEGLSEEGKETLGIDPEASVGQAVRQLRKNKAKLDQELTDNMTGQLGDTDPVISEEEREQLRHELGVFKHPETGKSFTDEEVQQIILDASNDLNYFEQVKTSLEGEGQNRTKIQRYEDARISFIRAEKEAPFEADLVNSQGNPTGARVIVERAGRGTKATVIDKNNRPVRSINKGSYDEVLRQLQYDGDENGSLIINDQNIELTGVADEAAATPVQAPEQKDPRLRRIHQWKDPKAETLEAETIEVEGPEIGRDVSGSKYLQQQLGLARRTNDLQERRGIMREMRERVERGEISQDLYDEAIARDMGPLEEAAMPELDMETIESQRATRERQERVEREERQRQGIPEPQVRQAEPTTTQRMEDIVGTPLREETETIDAGDPGQPRTYDDSEPSPEVVSVGGGPQGGLPQPAEAKPTVRDTEVARNRRASGHVSVIGTTVSDSETVGRAFEPLRNKESEWTYLVLRDKVSGEVLSVDGHSFLLPGASPGARDIASARRGDARFVEQMRQRVARLKGRANVSDVIVDVVHNHPGGKAQPSPQDLTANSEFVDLLDQIDGVEFGEHTIIDTGEATSIDRDGQWRMYDIYTNADLLTSEQTEAGDAEFAGLQERRARAREQDPLFGAYRRNDEVEAMFSAFTEGEMLTSEQRVTQPGLRNADIGQFLKNDQGKLALAVILDGSNNVRAALPFDVNMLKDQAQFKGWSRNRRAENGGRRLVVYYGAHDEEQQLDQAQFTELAELNIASGDVYDAIYVPRRDVEIRADLQGRVAEEQVQLSGEAPPVMDIPEAAIDEQPGRVTLREDIGEEAAQAIESNINPIDIPDARLAEDVAKIVDEANESASTEKVKPPRKTVTGFKLFNVNKRTKDEPDAPYALYVLNDTPVEVDKWQKAEKGELVEVRKPTGEIQTMVKGKGINALAYRPGWHATSSPAARHIGGISTRKGIGKKYEIDFRRPWEHWYPVEMGDDIDYQAEANNNQVGDDKKTAQITDKVPYGGHYRYTTNPNAEGDWIIGGELKVGQRLSREEARRLNSNDLPFLPEVIDQKGLAYEDLTKAAQEILEAWYPKKFKEMTGREPGKQRPHSGLAESVEDFETQLVDEFRQDPEYVPMDDPQRERNFQQWFGESKVVDRQGQPKRMYHGTPGSGFDTFDIWGSKFGLFGQGAYFTENPEIGSSYAKESGRAPGVLPVYLSIKNPLDMDAPANIDEWKQAFYEDWDEVREEIGGARALHELTDEDDTTNGAIFLALRTALVHRQIPRYEAAEIVMEGMEEMGYDGITHIGGKYTRIGRASGISHQVWIAWDPTQIKSATGNRGTFDPEDPSILREETEDLDEDSSMREAFRRQAKAYSEGEIEGVPRTDFFKTVTTSLRQGYVDREMEESPETTKAKKKASIDRRLKGNLTNEKVRKNFYEYLLEKGSQDDVDRYQTAIEVDAETWFLGGNRTPGIFINLTPEQVLEIARVEADGKLFDREMADKVGQQMREIRPPREGEVLLKTGHVETQLAWLIDKYDGKPPIDELAKLAGAPKPGNSPTTSSMFTRSIEDIKDRVIRGWQEMPGQYRWYNDFGNGAKSLVGNENLIEFSGVFAITSAQQPPRGNLADTLHLMATARDFFSQRHGYDGQTPLDVTKLDVDKTVSALTKYFVAKKIRPDGMKIFSNENQLKRIAKFYVTGAFDGGTKTGTYALNTFYRANNTFFPFTVNDVHVARGFGFVKKAPAKDKSGNLILEDDGSQKYVDNPIFGTDDEYRYAQYILSYISQDLGISPDQAQAAFWFYVKKHEAPSKDIDTKTSTGQGDGTYEDAAAFSGPEIDVLSPMLNLDNPLTNRFSNESIRVDGSRGYQVGDAVVRELKELSRGRGTRIAAALKPGKLGVTDVSFYTDDNRQPVPMTDLRDFYGEVEQAIVNPETGKIKALELLGIDHDYEGIEGSWEGREPSMFIRLPFSDDRQAEFVASLLGDAFDQQAMAIDNPKLYSPEEADAIVGAERKKLVAGVVFTKEDGSAFTDEEMAAIDNAIDPKDIPDYGPYEGQHYSLLNGRKELKLLNFTKWTEEGEYDLAEAMRSAPQFIQDSSTKVIGAINARVQGKSYIFRSYLREAGAEMGPVGGEESSIGYARGLEEGRHYLRRRPEGPDVHEGLIDNLYRPYASSLRKFIDQRGWSADLLSDERDPNTGPVSSTRLAKAFDVIDEPGDTAPDPEGRLTRLAEDIEDLEPGDVTGKARRLFNRIFSTRQEEAPPVSEAAPPPAPELAPGVEERRFPQSLERAGRIAPQGESRYYVPQSNLETRRKVEQTFEKEGLTGLLRMVDSDNQEPSAERTAAGIWLHAYYMDQATRERADGNDEAANTALERAVDVASLVSTRLTRAGQEVQAANMIGLLSPESVGIYAQRRIDKINEKHGLNRKDKADKKRVLSDKDYARFKTLALKAEALTEIGADAEELDSAMKDLVEKKTLTPDQVAQIDNFRTRYKQTLEGEPVDPRDEGIRSRQEPSMGWRKILRKKVSEKAEEARKRLREQGRIRAGIPVDEMADLVLIGVDKMAELGEGYKSWQQAMQSELAMDVSSADMHKIYNKSMDAYKQDRKEARREFAQLKLIDEFIEKVAAEPPLQDSQDIAAVVEAIKTMKTANEDARIAIGQEVELMLKRLEPRGWGDYLTTVLHIGRLLAPKTAGRNIIGNTLAWYAERFSMATAATIDRGLSAATGREREIVYTPAQSNVFNAIDFIRGVPLYGVTEAFRQATPELREGFRAGYRGVSPRGLPTAADLPQTLTFDPLSEDYRQLGGVGQAAFRGLRTLEGVMSAQLKGFDFAAYMRAYNTVLHEQARLAIKNQNMNFDDNASRDAWVSNWLSRADTNIVKMADDYARYVTFQDDTVLATAGRAIKNLANLDRDFIGKIAGEDVAKKIPWKTTMIGEFLLAYPRVPANLINRGLAYSPAGILKSAIQFSRAAREVETGSYREGVMALSRALVGSGGGALVWHLAKLGLMTGQEEEDYDLVELKRQTTGEGKYRINISGVSRYIEGGFNEEDAKKKKGDKLISYDWAQPLAISAAFTVNAQQAMDVKLRKDARRGIGGMMGETGRLVAEGARGAYNIIEEQPMLTGMKDLFQSYNRSSGALDGMVRILSNVPAGFVPQVINQVRQVTDNTSRVTYVPDNPAQTAVNKLINRLPFVSDVLPKMYKTLGAEMPREIYAQGGNDFFSVFLSPAFVSEYNPDPVALMLLEPFETSGEVGQIPRRQPSRVTIGGIQINLTLEDRAQMQRVMAAHVTRNMERFKKTSMWVTESGKRKRVRRSPDEQLEAMKDIVSLSGRAARDWFILNRIDQYKGEDDPKAEKIYKKEKLKARKRKRALTK